MDELSKEHEEFRTHARAEYRDQFESSEGLLEANMSLVVLLPSELSPARITAFTLWCRCLGLCRAAMMLCESGMAHEALVSMRTALECLFYCGALLKDESTLNIIENSSFTEKRKQINGWLSLGEETGLPPHQLETLRNCLVEWPDPKVTFSAYEAAEASGLLLMYHREWRGLSLVSAHPTLTSTDPFLGLRSDGSVELLFGPSDNLIVFTLRLTADVLAAGRDMVQAALTDA